MTMPLAAQDLLHKGAVADLVQRERLARDNGQWEEMAACWHPESTVDVSWFKGTGAEFVASTVAQASKRIATSTAINFHVMSPAVVTVRNDRAIAETPCALRSFMQLDGVDVSRDGFVKLLWRARLAEEQWLIAGLRCIYVRDLLLACNPTRPPVLDEARLNSYRLSYRYLTYTLTALGLASCDDLPGEDRPETVAALRAGERRWLEEG